MTPPDVSKLEAELLATVADGIVIADEEGRILSWNEGAARIFGYTAAEAIGQRLDLIIPEQLRERHWTGYAASMASGTTRYGDQLLAVPAVDRDGNRLSIEFHVALLGLEDGSARAIGAVIRDVTAHWQEDRELRKRLAELEARSGEGPLT